MSNFESTIPASARQAVEDLAAGRPKAGDGDAREYWISIDVGVEAVPGVDNTEQDSGKDLPPTGVVLDLLIEVITPETTAASKLMDVGTLTGETGADPDGFADGISVATAGLIRPGVTMHSGSDYPASTTRGANLAYFTAGSGTDDRGLYIEKPYLTDSVDAKSISWTLAGSDFAEFVGKIWIKVAEF